MLLIPCVSIKLDMITNRKLLFLVALGLFLCIIINAPENYEKNVNVKDTDSVRERTNNTIKNSGFWTVPRIHINGNWSATNTTYDWCYGKGTLTEPYIIENITVNAGGVGSCIFIENTADYFIIRNCTFINSGPGVYDSGIRLEDVSKGKILSNNISVGHHGIYLTDCYNNTLGNNNITKNTGYGIIFTNGDNITLEYNSIITNENIGICLTQYSDKNWIINNEVIDNKEEGIKLIQSGDNRIVNNNVSDTRGASNVNGIYLYNNCNNNTISRNNASYNVNSGIYLDASCLNNSISGNNANNNQYGIQLKNCNNNTISGNIANDNIYGIYLYTNCNNNSILGNIANDNDFYGIYIDSGKKNTISGNNMTECGLGINGNLNVIHKQNITSKNKVNGRALYYFANKTGLGTDNFTNAGQVILVNCNNSLISVSNVSHGSNGISLFYCRNNTISENNAGYCKSNGIYLYYSNNNTILENNVTHCNNGMQLYFSNNNTISENYAMDSNYGMYISNSNNNTISRNNATYGNYGIYLSYSNNCTISENNANNGNYGIYFQTNSKYNKILENNVIYSNYRGIYLSGSNNNTILGNKISHSQYGIYIQSNSKYNKILGNNASYSNYGMYVTNCNNNTISENNASYCSNYGICLISCNYTEITGNNASYSNYGMYVEKSSNNTISENNANNCNYGIYLQSNSKHNKILGNNASYNANRGIFLYSGCNNNELSGNNVTYNPYGIYLEYSNNNTISGNNVNFNSYHGISLYYDSDNNEISGNIANKNDYGIYLVDSDKNEISKNNMTECGLSIHVSVQNVQVYLKTLNSQNITTTNTVNGRTLYYYVNKSGLGADNFTNAGQVILVNCSNSVISGLDVSYSSNGISIIFGNNNSISLNNASYCKNNGIYFFAFNNTEISANNASHCKNYGIYLTCSQSSSINNCTILGNDVSYDTNYGICLYYGKNNTIAGNIATNSNGYGIFLDSSINNTISGNTADNNYCGIYLYFCDNNTILGNVLNNNSAYGIWLFQSNYNNILNNHIGPSAPNNEDSIGIDLYNQCKNNKIINNEFEGNGIGISLEEGSNNNSFYDNRIIENKRYGVSIPSGSFESQYNLFVGNTFDNPFGINAVDDCSLNNWNDNTRGNWWEDYSGDDANNDGIGDTPYNIPGTAGARDYKPIGKFPLATKDDDDDNKGVQQTENNIIVIIIIIVIGCTIAVASYGVIRAKKSKNERIISQMPSSKKLTIKAPEIKQAEIQPTDTTKTAIPAVGLNELPKKMDLEPAKLKKVKGVSQGSEQVVDLTEEEKKETEKIASEVGVDKQQFICVVHKGPIIGANYLCPHCQTFYCVKCAKTLKEKGEKCWSCNTDIEM